MQNYALISKITNFAFVKTVFSNMFKVPLAGSFQGFCDCNCHVLPGVDDGFRTMESSLSMLEEYESAGVATVCFTPHIMQEMPSATADLKEVFEELKGNYHGRVQLHLASENMMDFLFGQRMEARDLLPLPGRRLLIEAPYYNPPEDFHTVIERIRKTGYIPLLAHPERYVYMDDAEYRRLKGMGVQFQLDLPSIAGIHGAETMEKAVGLLADGMYDCAGTDIHCMDEFKSLKEMRIPRGIAAEIMF